MINSVEHLIKYLAVPLYILRPFIIWVQSLPKSVGFSMSWLQNRVNSIDSASCHLICGLVKRRLKTDAAAFLYIWVWLYPLFFWSQLNPQYYCLLRLWICKVLNIYKGCLRWWTDVVTIIHVPHMSEPGKQ